MLLYKTKLLTILFVCLFIWTSSKKECSSVQEQNGFFDLSEPNLKKKHFALRHPVTWSDMDLGLRPSKHYWDEW